MDFYVIVRREDEKYVSRSGFAYSYTDKLQFARVFSSYDHARNCTCPDNEYVVNARHILEANMNGR